MHKLLWMYTVWNLVLVAISSFGRAIPAAFHSFVGANTVIIAFLVTYLHLRTGFAQLPYTYYDLVRGNHVAARILDICIHYVPLLIVTISRDPIYYMWAMAILSVWFVSMWMSKKLEWMYAPMRQDVMIEAWVVMLVVMKLIVRKPYPNL